MKLLTLNSHSLEETDYERKLEEFQQALLLEKPQIIALQEVNQRWAPDVPGTDPASHLSPEAPFPILKQSRYIPCPPVPGERPAIIRQDNHAFQVAVGCAERGLSYYWTWIPCKIGYGKYEEGLAIFSREPIQKTRQFYITGSQDHLNWKTRKILGVTVETHQGPQHFFSVHMGWWNDEEEPFAQQWLKIMEGLSPLSKDPIWLMGDFNSPSHVTAQGYDLLRESGWLDTYLLAEDRDQGFTVTRTIDGWKDGEEISHMRIDYIWTNRPVPVTYFKTIFNGDFYSGVSDHCGIIVEL